jgi:transketolase
VVELHFIPKSEFDRLREAEVEEDVRLALIADMCRLNALVAVKRAGSGHLGSTFSALDLVVHLLFERLNTRDLGWDDPDRDVFFSSKGHDVPGLYSALHALGVVPSEKLLALRRLGGLDGHPDVHTPGVEANSGSLGMGISKGRGLAWAKWNLGRGGRVVVLTGDGELQEGQNWEALQAAAHDRVANLTVVVDRNELQSDKPTELILALGDLEGKLQSFGWHVVSCDGHDHAALRSSFDELARVDDRPQALVARTIKGKGVSFMEHSAALAEGGGFYRWHAGAPGDEDFERARAELVDRIAGTFVELELAPLGLTPVDAAEESQESLEGEPVSGAGAPLHAKVTDEYVVDAYGEELVELARAHDHLVVLDADLASDCRIRSFELTFPDRFVECGIAEQDMVSASSAIARQGLLPIVNSFAAFLASRANEQIYNQASEGTKVVYALHYAGLIPAGPGKSHQSLRDVSLLASLPGMTVVQPANSEETRALLRWAVEDADENVALRLAIGPSPRRIELEDEYRAEVGRGSILRTGDDALLFSYGPVMLHEALRASELLAPRGVGVAVVNLPWLNRVEGEWLEDLVAPFDELLVLEDHAPVGALGDTLRRRLDGRRITVFGVEGWPACGTPQEALRFHGLDGESLAERIALVLGAVA